LTSTERSLSSLTIKRSRTVQQGWAILMEGRRAMNRPSKRRVLIVCGTALASLLFLTGSGSASNFFEGKTLRFFVGIPPGGAYDLVPRILAAHIGKYIAGSPKIIIENMPGAGSLTMMNYLYNRAARDGTAIGFPMNTILLEPSLKLVSGASGNAQFDLSRMAWIGTPGEDPAVAWVGGASPIKNFEDLKTKGATFGSTGAGADSTILANLSNKLLGSKIKIVAGYKGAAEYLMAFEGGEIDGAVTTYAALLAARPDWIKDGRIRLIAQFGAERNKDLPDVPTGVELASEADAKAMLRLYGVKFAAAYPVVLPPDVPAEQVKTLRDAFAATMDDPDYKAQLDAMRISGGIVTPATIDRFVRDVDGAPRDIIDRLRQVLEGK
jgi:tripartite-type tricarboxylate transporter receptor subunit TctC